MAQLYPGVAGLLSSSSVASNDAGDIERGNVPHARYHHHDRRRKLLGVLAQHSAQLTTLTAHFQRSGALVHP